jgi:hypothetical protein
MHTKTLCREKKEVLWLGTEEIPIGKPLAVALVEKSSLM